MKKDVLRNMYERIVKPLKRPAGKLYRVKRPKPFTNNSKESSYPVIPEVVLKLMNKYQSDMARDSFVLRRKEPGRYHS